MKKPGNYLRFFLFVYGRGVIHKCKMSLLTELVILFVFFTTKMASLRDSNVRLY